MTCSAGVRGAAAWFYDYWLGRGDDLEGAEPDGGSVRASVCDDRAWQGRKGDVEYVLGDRALLMWPDMPDRSRPVGM